MRQAAQAELSALAEADARIREEAADRAAQQLSGAEQLFGNAWPDHQRAGQVLAFHQFLDGERRHDVDGLAGIVALAMAGRAFDQRLAISDAGLLRGLRQAIDVAAERDDRLPGTPPGDPCGRDAGNAALDRKAVLLQHGGQVFRGLEFLVGELAEAEHGVVHDLGELAPRLDAADDGGLENLDPGGVVLRFGCFLRRGGGRHNEKRGNRGGQGSRSRRGCAEHDVPPTMMSRRPPAATGDVRRIWRWPQYRAVFLMVAAASAKSFKIRSLPCPE